jgi:hypothetical protein
MTPPHSCRMQEAGEFVPTVLIRFCECKTNQCGINSQTLTLDLKLLHFASYQMPRKVSAHERCL